MTPSAIPFTFFNRVNHELCPFIPARRLQLISCHPVLARNTQVGLRHSLGNVLCLLSVHGTRLF